MSLKPLGCRIPNYLDFTCATSSNYPYSCGPTGDDLWFFFEATSKDVQIELNNDGSQHSLDSLFYFEVYDQMPCNTGSILCSFGAFNHTIYINDAPIGQKYYIRVVSLGPQRLRLCVNNYTLPDPIWVKDNNESQIYVDGLNVGINKTDPQASLDIIGNVIIDYMPQLNSNAPALDVRGNIAISGELIVDSDQRYKQNIRSINSAADALSQLNPVIYNYNTDQFPERHFTEKEKMGLLAQEVEKVFPNIVSTNTAGYKAINYLELIPLLVKAIQEQQEEIKLLKGNKQN
jgi:hypothetical protein